MCGVAGYTGPKHDGLLDRMIDVVRSRGPDGDGRYSAADIELGHTRLAILDIDGGAQPMSAEDGRFVVSYNGEIYNYLELRRRIEKTGRVFRTTCDTELIPLGFAAFGTAWFAELNGIFAFALYDSLERRLYLVRDHFGVKPLYFGNIESDIVFSSSARAVALHPKVDRSLNPDSVREYLQFRYVPSGRHFYRGVETLPPGTYLKIRDSGRRELVHYWRPRARTGVSTLSSNEWVEAIEATLDDVAARQLRSDVPVGLFLSGGVDSSTIAHFAQRHCPYPMTSYTFSMGEADDEVECARAIAERTGSRHVTVDHSLTRDFSRLYDAVNCMDMPVGDAIVLPTYLLCEAAARDTKVVLTGEGADEVFGGYVHFAALAKLQRLRRLIPLGHHLGPLVRLLPVALLDRHFDYQASLGTLGRMKLSRMIRNIRSPRTLFRLASSVVDDWDIAEATDFGPAPAEQDLDLGLSSLMLETVKTWLPYQILNKMDQLSMAHGLEARVPFLDPALYELLSSAPDELILDGDRNKILLRAVLQRHGLDWQRPKFAFHVPMEKQYRPSLERLCQEWLAPSVVSRHGVVRQGFIERNLKHLERSGDFLASKRLVTIVCLHMWLDGHDGER